MKLLWNKDGSMQIPKGFRVLKENELVQKEDMWPDDEHGVWRWDSFRYRAGMTAEGAIYIRQEELYDSGTSQFDY